MLKNYFTIAWRNLLKSKVYSSINILGLAVGMAVALLISLWIYDELSYNKSFANYNRIVQVYETSTHGSETATFNSMPIPLAGEFRTKYGADFEKVVLASWTSQTFLPMAKRRLARTGCMCSPIFHPYSPCIC